MSAILGHHRQWIWLSFSRENCRHLRGTLKAADSPPYGVLLHESMQEMNMPIIPKVHKKPAQSFHQAVEKNIWKNWEGLVGRKSGKFARQARS